MEYLSVFPLGLSDEQIIKLKGICAFASTRGVQWEVATSIEKSVGVIAAANGADNLGACQHFHSIGGCICLVNSAIGHGLKSIQGPLRLSGGIAALDYFRDQKSDHSLLSENIATLDLLHSFSKSTDEHVSTDFEELAKSEASASWKTLHPSQFTSTSVFRVG